MPVPRLRLNRFEDASGFARPHDSRHHAEDLRDFHLPMTRLHNADLHVSGVLAGLEVHALPDGTELTVEAGVALDSAGRLVVLGSDGRADIGSDPAGGSHDERPVPVTLPVPAEPGLHYVTVQFNLLVRADEGASGRLEHAPWLRVQPAGGAADEAAVVLAVVDLAPGNGADDTPRVRTLAASLPGAASGRRLAGRRVGELALGRGAQDPTDGPSAPAGSVVVGESVAGRLRPGPSGGLAVTVSGTADTITLAHERGDRFARLDIQAEDTLAAGTLRVAESLSVARTLTVDDEATVTGTVTGGALHTGGTLTVDGAATVAGTLTAAELRSSGALHAAGDAAVEGTLTAGALAGARADVTGTVTAGQLSADGVAVGGPATFGATVTAAQLNVSGELQVNGDAGVGGALAAGELEVTRANVTGVATVGGRLTAGQLRTTGSLRVDGALNVIGAISAGGNSVALVSQGGRVGVGISSPQHELHVDGRIASGRDRRSAGAMTFYPPDGFAWFHIDNGPAGGRPTGRLRISHGPEPGDDELVSVLQNGRVGIGTSVPAVSLHVVGNRVRLTKARDATHFVELRADGNALDLESRGADLFINNHGLHSTRIRNLVQISSGRFKQQVAVLSAGAAGDLLERLEPVTFCYTDDPGTERVGFIAESLPELVCTRDGEGYRPADVLAVLTAVVREHRAVLAGLTGGPAAVRSAPTTASDPAPER